MLKEKNLSRQMLTLEDADGKPLSLVLRKITPRTDDLYSQIVQRHEAELKAVREDFPTYFQWFNMPETTEEMKAAKMEYFVAHREKIEAEADQIKATAKKVKRRHLFEVLGFMVDREASGLSEEAAGATIDSEEWFTDQDLDAMGDARERFRTALDRF